MVADVLGVAEVRSAAASMSKTRNNHYVPRWYQEGFLEPGKNTLAYLDTTPPERLLPNGRKVTERALFDSPTSRAFVQLDLYSTFFGATIKDDIERYLFGDMDVRGARAIRAFQGTNVGEWHRHFQTLFAYIDIQKIRTPKGLDWLKAQYPIHTQNELMLEMQGIQMMHCTLWTEGVREIVSAVNTNVKFILSDHPVTIYNRAAAPGSKLSAYPNDPSIALKGSQTIFPLSRDYCLILTNLEYARDPSTAPLQKRTFPRNFRNSMVRTDAFIRSRTLDDREVIQINRIIKSGAKRYIAAGRKEWLEPEKALSEPWSAMAKTILPPTDELWHFGGEMYASFDNGHVQYQDEFGRTEKPRDFLKKEPPTKPLRGGDFCACGSGRPFKECCHTRPLSLRSSWAERSIRERNLMLYTGIVNVLAIDPKKNWIEVRQELTDEQISEIYSLYEGLWPLETDLLGLLPKPDGTARAVYTGIIHPSAITDFAIGASAYFEEILVEHPFVHPGIIRKEYNPVHNPQKYRQEFLKSLMLFLTIMPLVQKNLVNLVPDPGNFNFHLLEQTRQMAEFRSVDTKTDLKKEQRIQSLMKDDFQRSLRTRPRSALRAEILRLTPDLDESGVESVLREIERRNERDPLSVLHAPMTAHDDSGQMSLMKLAPNFEMTMYIAQATGSSIVTDNRYRWDEIRRAILWRFQMLDSGLPDLARIVRNAAFAFPQDSEGVLAVASSAQFKAYHALWRDVFKYLANVVERGSRPNREASIRAAFERGHAPAQATLKRMRISTKQGKITCAFPLGGTQDNSVNRLLLMSSSEHHLRCVPMAFYIEQ